MLYNNFMSYQVLYRTYRPSRFEEVIGQDYIVKTLINAIKLKKIAHAYLFAGPRGTGKTSVAKLFAKAINCEEFNGEPCDGCNSCLAYKDNDHPDIIELDAASNNSVDDIREIIEQVPYAPMIGKYKVYIIDEVHMLTQQAFNALLKTLEEPPSHVVFILATTDPQKIIPTVLSRCQRYNFSKISNVSMKKRMIEILNKENIKYEEEALDEVAILAEGGMRDALSILEQILSYNPEGVFLDDVSKIYGLSTSEEKVNLLLSAHSDIKKAVTLLREMYNSGIDCKRLAIDLLEIIKESLIFSDDGDGSLLNKLDPAKAKLILNNISPNSLLEDISYLDNALSKTKGNQNFLSYLELALVKMNQNLHISYKAQTKEQEAIKKEEVKVIEEPTKSPIEEEVVSKAVEQEEKVEEKVVDCLVEEDNTKDTDEDSIDLNYLAGLLLNATKDSKINDQIIYNRLDIYKFEADKRKFYELLKGTNLFASGKDVIIITGEKMKVNNINSKQTRSELYEFVLNEFGIDKVIYAIEESQRSQLVSLYKDLVRQKDYVKPEVIKPVIKKELTNEEKVKQLFDNVRVEE